MATARLIDGNFLDRYRTLIGINDHALFRMRKRVLKLQISNFDFLDRFVYGLSNPTILSKSEHLTFPELDP